MSAKRQGPHNASTKGIASAVTMPLNDLMEIFFRDRLEYQNLMSSALIHELHMPLTLMRERINRIKLDPTNHQTSGLEALAADCQQLLQFLNSMTSMTAQKAEPELHLIYVEKTLKEILVFFKKICLDKGISLQLEVDHSLSVRSEPVRLKNLILALINNSIDSFSALSTQYIRNITIHSHQDKINTYLIVSDTGCGMSPFIQDQVLNRPFFSTKTSKYSSGLGLPLANKMAQDLNIEMTFLSEPGKGSSFSLAFPNQPSSAISESSSEEVKP